MDFSRFLHELFKRPPYEEYFKGMLGDLRSRFLAIWYRYLYRFFSGLPSITFTVAIGPCRGDDGRPLSAAEQHVRLSYTIVEGRRPVTSIRIIRLYAFDHDDIRVPHDYSEEVYSVPPAGSSIDHSHLSASDLEDHGIEQLAMHKGDSLFYTNYKIEVRTPDAIHNQTRAVQFGPQMGIQRTSPILGAEAAVKADPTMRTAFIDLAIDNVREILTQPVSRPGTAPTVASIETGPGDISFPGMTRVQLTYDFPPGFTPGTPDNIHFILHGYDETPCGVPAEVTADFMVTIVPS